MLIQVPPPGFERVKVTRFYAAYVRVLRPTARARPRLARPAAGCCGSWRARSALRLWGHRPRPAVRLQRRRERPLRAARGRDVRALLQPGLLRQPARLHVPAARSCSTCASAAAQAVGRRAAADRTSVFELARAVVGACSGTLSVALLLWAGRRLLGAAARADRGRAAGRRVPARALRAPGAQRRAGARAGVPGAGRAWPAIYRDNGLRAATRWRASALGAGLRDQVHGRDPRADDRRRRARRRRRRGPRAARACCWPACWRCAASSSPTRSRCWTSTRSATASATSRRPRATAAASSASRPTAGSSTTSAPPTWGLGWLPALAAARRRDRAGVARPRGWPLVLVPGAARRSWSSWARRTASSPAGCCPSTRCCACSRRGRWWPPRSGSRRACGGATPLAAGVLGVLLCVQGLVFSIHNDLVLARDGHPPARARLDGRQRPDPLQGGDRAVRARRLGGRRRRASARAPATASAGTSGRPRARPTRSAAA